MLALILGGGAGIQADLKTFSALQVYGASVITALTAQNTHAGRGRACGAARLRARARCARSPRICKVDAIKIGMLATGPVIEAVAEGA